MINIQYTATVSSVIKLHIIQIELSNWTSYVKYLKASGHITAISWF